MTKHEGLISEDNRLRQQAQAEFDFAAALEANGYDTDHFMRDMELSTHQFNVLAHYIYDVNDEEPLIMPQIRALIAAVRSAENRASVSEVAGVA